MGGVDWTRTITVTTQRSYYDDHAKIGPMT
jgi:hypothetical protein